MAVTYEECRKCGKSITVTKSGARFHTSISEAQMCTRLDFDWPGDPYKPHLPWCAVRVKHPCSCGVPTDE